MLPVTIPCSNSSSISNLMILLRFIKGIALHIKALFRDDFCWNFFPVYCEFLKFHFLSVIYHLCVRAHARGGERKRKLRSYSAL